MNCPAIVFPALLASAVLTACSGAGPSKREFAKACTDVTNMPDQVCSCVSDKAAKELSPDTRSFLIAGMRQDRARTDELRARLSLADLTKAGMFMVNAAATCGVTIPK